MAQGQCGAFVNNAARFPWWILTEVVDMLGGRFFIFFILLIILSCFSFPLARLVTSVSDIDRIFASRR